MSANNICGPSIAGGRRTRSVDAEAAHRIGQLYARGEGVMYSLPDAVIWYRQAADAGHLEAQFHLGLIHLQGHEAPRGVGGPRHWLDFASQRDDQQARATLDALFPNGISVEPDLDEALRWLHAAAQGGKAEAQVVLGDLARTGRGGAQDFGEARSLV